MPVFEIHDSKITEMPPIPEETTELFCRGCTSLRTLPDLPNLTELFCSGCTSLTSLPILPNLTWLYCLGCTSLTFLPELPNLTRLDCWNCTSLAFLPELPKLSWLSCWNCTSLRYRPKLHYKCDYDGPPLLSKEEYISQQHLKAVKNYEETRIKIPVIRDLENLVKEYMYEEFVN